MTKANLKQLRTLQIPKDELLGGTLRELRDRESFARIDEDSGDLIFKGDIFQIIIKEQEKLQEFLRVTPNIMKELKELEEACKDIDLIYVIM